MATEIIKPEIVRLDGTFTLVAYDFILNSISQLISESFGGEVNTLSDEEYSAIFDSAKREMLAFIDSNKPEGVAFDAAECVFTANIPDDDRGLERAIAQKISETLDDVEMDVGAWLDCKADDVQELRAEYPGRSMSKEQMIKFLYSN